jgi:membrane protein DedA with SNARE-associated domain
MWFKKKYLEYSERLFENYGDKVTIVGTLLPSVKTFISAPTASARNKMKMFVIF